MHGPWLPLTLHALGCNFQDISSELRTFFRVHLTLRYLELTYGGANNYESEKSLSCSFRVRTQGQPLGIDKTRINNYLNIIRKYSSP